MTDATLTQSEADRLLEMEKRWAEGAVQNYPAFGGRITAPLVSLDGRERFFLDLRRARINIRKETYQNRARQTVILARLDIGGAPHRNPDGKEVESPHLHLYQEGYGDKWAFPLPSGRFPNLGDSWLTLTDFMRFCNIVEPPRINKSLFT